MIRVRQEEEKKKRRSRRRRRRRRRRSRRRRRRSQRRRSSRRRRRRRGRRKEQDKRRTVKHENLQWFQYSPLKVCSQDLWFVDEVYRNLHYFFAQSHCFWPQNSQKTAPPWLRRATNSRKHTEILNKISKNGLKIEKNAAKTSEKYSKMSEFSWNDTKVRKIVWKTHKASNRVKNTEIGRKFQKCEKRSMCPFEMTVCSLFHDCARESACSAFKNMCLHLCQGMCVCVCVCVCVRKMHLGACVCACYVCKMCLRARENWKQTHTYLSVRRFSSFFWARKWGGRYFPKHEISKQGIILHLAAGRVTVERQADLKLFWT